MKRFLRLALLIIVAGLIATPAQAGSPKKKGKKPTRWVPVAAAQFNVVDQLGSFTSCAYRLCEAGKSAEFVFENKVRIVAKKSESSEIKVDLALNKKEIRNVSRDTVVEAVEDATQQCFERLSDEE